MTKTKKLICAILAAAMAMSVFTACGKKATDPTELTEKETAAPEHMEVQEPDSEPFEPEEIPSEFAAQGSNITANESGGVDVAIETRSGDDSYTFEDEDLGFVDTTTGAMIKIGMSADEVESLIGLPRVIDTQYIRYYSGIVIRYDENYNVDQLVVATGNMEEGDDPSRFVTPRGLKLNATLDEFISIYGDDYSEPEQAAEGDETIKSSATVALRYYAKDGDSFNYLGSTYSAADVPENDSDLITQSFLFSTETQTVSVITIKSGTKVN